MSKSLNECAGYVNSHMNPWTGIPNVIYIAKEAGVVTDDTYIIACEGHSEYISTSDIQNAEDCMKDATKRCPTCKWFAECA